LGGGRGSSSVRDSKRLEDEGKGWVEIGGGEEGHLEISSKAWS